MRGGPPSDSLSFGITEGQKTWKGNGMAEATTLRLVLVDDDAHDLERLRRDLEAICGRLAVEASITCLGRAEDLLAHFSSGTFDVAFLDVRMAGVDGLELARRVRALDAALTIVFVTTSADYALEAYPSHPFDYLVKPYDERRLQGLVADVLRARREGDDAHITIRVPHDTRTVYLSSVTAVESHGHKSLLILTDDLRLESIMRFSEVEDLLCSDPRFLEVNRGIVCNLDKVLRLERDVLVMEGGLRYPLRKRDRARLVSKVSNYLLSRMGPAHHG